MGKRRPQTLLGASTANGEPAVPVTVLPASVIYPAGGGGDHTWAPTVPAPRGGQPVRGMVYALPISLLLWASLALTIWAAWLA